jgi:hypothetical protein
MTRFSVGAVFVYVCLVLTLAPPVEATTNNGYVCEVTNDYLPNHVITVPGGFSGTCDSGMVDRQRPGQPLANEAFTSTWSCTGKSVAVVDAVVQFTTYGCCGTGASACASSAAPVTALKWGLLSIVFSLIGAILCM